MPVPVSRFRSFRHARLFLSPIAAVSAVVLCAMGVALADDAQPSREVLSKGAEIFAREWLPRDSKDAGGDGLGPVYNETSCLACHHQGGPGAPARPV